MAKICRERHPKLATRLENIMNGVTDAEYEGETFEAS